MGRLFPLPCASVYLLTVAALRGLVQEPVLEHEARTALLQKLYAFVASCVFFSLETNGQ